MLNPIWWQVIKLSLILNEGKMGRISITMLNVSALYIYFLPVFNPLFNNEALTGLGRCVVCWFLGLQSLGIPGNHSF